MSVDDLSLNAIRRELHRLTSLADSTERPKPTRINDADHPMPGHEWDLREQPHPYGSRDYIWVIRALEDQDTADGKVYVSTPDSMFPGQDFVPMYSSDARRVALALLAAADRAEHLALGIPRLEDHRKPTKDLPHQRAAGQTSPSKGDQVT